MGGYQLNSLLAKQVELDTPTIKEANGSFARDELESAYSWLSNQSKQSRFEARKFHGITVDGDNATVDLTLFGMVELPQYRPADGEYRVKFDWQRESDGWRIRRAVWTEIP